MGSIDWGYPNPHAIAAMNAYGMSDIAIGKPEGTTQAAYDSWTAFQNKHQSRYTGPDLNRWEDEVRGEHPEWVDAHNWYERNILDINGWRTLVKEYKAKITDPSNVTPPAFTDKPDWLDESVTPTNSGFIPPGIDPTFRGDTASISGVAVNTAALEWFANEVLGSVVGDGNILLTTAQQLMAVDPLPGAFARAEVLRQAVVGTTAQDGGVRGDMKEMLVNMNTALLAVQDALLKMAGQYKDLEELNSLTTDKLTEVMGASLKGLDGLTGFGQKVINTGGN